MKTLGDRVRERRTELGLSQPQLAKKVGGLTYQAIQALEAGGGTKHILSIARALSVTPDWLENGTNPKEAASTSDNQIPDKRPNEMSQNPLPPGDKLKVLGMAECGPDGFSTWNGEIVDWVPRPASLAGAKDAYAVFIVGDSMENRYHPGEVAFIHPGKPITPGAYVLVQRRPKEPGEPPLALIKRLVRRSGDKLVLEQLNPPKSITLAMSDVVSIHRVVGSLEA